MKEPGGEEDVRADRLRLRFSIQKAERWLGITLLCLSAIHLLTWYLHFYTSLDIFTIFRVFDFDEEANIPTLFNTALFGVASLLALLIGVHGGRERRRYRRHWLFLGILFAALAVDEFTSMHETLVEPVRRALGISGGFFYLAWVIPALILCAAGALLLLPFLLRLPPAVRRLMALAAVIYLLGAVGFEMVQGFLTTGYAEAHVLRRMATFLEEFLEMTGLIVLIKALLVYITAFIPPLLVEVRP